MEETRVKVYVVLMNDSTHIVMFPCSLWQILAGKYPLPIVPRAQLDLMYSINPTEKYPAQGHINSKRSSLSQLVLPSVLQTYWHGVAAMTSPHNPVKSFIRVLTRKIRLNPASERVFRRRFRVRTRRKLGVDNASATAGTVEMSANEMSVDYMDPQTHPPKGNWTINIRCTTLYAAHYLIPLAQGNRHEQGSTIDHNGTQQWNRHQQLAVPIKKHFV